MTTKEYIKKLELDVQKLKIHEKLEDDPKARSDIIQRKESRSDLLANIRTTAGSGVQTATKMTED